FDEYVSDGTVDDVSVLSRSEQGEFAFKPVEVATRRRYDGPLHTIRTKMNKRVTVTHDHPMITLKGNDTAVKPAAELEAGDSVPVLADLPSDPVSEFDLIEIVAESPDFENDRVYLKPSTPLEANKDKVYEVLRAYNGQFDYHKVSDLVRDNYLPLDVFLTYEEELPVDREDLSLYTTRGGGQTYVPAILRADERFWRFIGYYLSEGHINNDTSGHGSTTRRR
ncbi:nucleotide sugar dehydrogenase, partial [Halorubrum sp. SD626R]